MNHGAHNPDAEMAEECGCCDGTGKDGEARAPHEATTCYHCRGTGIEPVKSREDHRADMADAARDEV